MRTCEQIRQEMVRVSGERTRQLVRDLEAIHRVIRPVRQCQSDLTGVFPVNGPAA